MAHDDKYFEETRKSLFKYVNNRAFLSSSSRNRGSTNSVQQSMRERIKKVALIDKLETAQVATIGKGNGNGGGEDCCFSVSMNERKNVIAVANGKSELLLLNEDGQKTKQFKTQHREIVTQIHFMDNNKHRLENDNRKTSTSHAIDDEFFYTSSLDKTIKVWHGENNIQTLKDHKDWIRCLDTSCDNSTLLSGCISGRIFGYDINKEHQILFQIQNDPQNILGGLNTINSILCTNHSPSMFYTGSRDGYIRLYDSRNLVFNSNTGSNTVKPIFKIKAHEGKMNQLQITKDDHHLLSSGRDSVIRLFDVRKLPTGTSDQISNLDSSVIQKYQDHKCKSYNVSSCFFDNEKYVLTGSEDNKVYIYEKDSGKLLRTLNGHEGVVHLILNINDNRLLTNSIESSRLFFWETSTQKVNIKMDTEIDDSFERSILERVMRQHGDQILNLYHSNSLNNENENMGLGMAMNQLVVSPENEHIFRDILQTFISTLVQEQGGNSILPNLDDLLDSSDDETF